MNKQSRIEAIINEPLTGPLARRRTKRFLAVLAVIASWTYLLTLSPGNYIELPFRGSALLVRLFASIVMLVSYVFLRRSVRHITSVPDEYLDERQLLNRDWAYSSGYLVVRRVGLILSIAFIVLMVTYEVWNVFYYAIVPGADPIDPAAYAIYRSVVDYLRAYFAIDPLQASGSILLLLTYVAYSFPIILLAWRDAKTNDESELLEIENNQWLRILTRGYKGYFVRMLWLSAGVLLFFITVFSPAREFIWLAIWSLFGTLVYALYVYAWGMLQQWQAVKLIRLKARSMNPTQKGRLQFALFVANSLIGMSILFGIIATIFEPSSTAIWWGYAFYAGLALLVSHLVSFANIRNLVLENRAH